METPPGSVNALAIKRRRSVIVPPARKRRRQSAIAPGGIEFQAVLPLYTKASASVGPPTSKRVGAVERAVVVDWLADVCSDLNMRDTTWALAVSLVDRYLALERVSLRRLQLAGATSIFIASKHEERVPVRLAHLVDCCAGAVRRADILTVEKAILNRLNWSVRAPLPLLFVEVICTTSKQKNIAKYAAKIALLDNRLTAVAPPIIAAACASVAAACLGVDAPKLAVEVPKHAVRKVSRRILRVWVYAVASHEASNPVYLVREFPELAACIFPAKVKAEIAIRFGDDVALTSDGAFATWAAAQRI